MLGGGAGGRVAGGARALVLLLLLVSPCLCAGAQAPRHRNLNQDQEDAPFRQLHEQVLQNRSRIGAAASRPGVLNARVQIGPFTGTIWRGWGTALAWFANFAGGLPRAQREFILDKLFDPVKGLGLNIVRYILPGGLDPKASPYLASLQFQTSPGFRPSPRGAYDWTADARQRAMLQGALRRGAIAEAQAYSPPAWMTISGDVAGNRGGAPNLAPRNYQAFVDYLADVLLHFKTAWNVSFAGFNPFNEPLSGWWRTGNNQEGCGFPLESLSGIFTLMHRAMVRRGLGSTKMVGIDEWATRTMGALQNQSVLWTQVSRVALHAYRVPSPILPRGNDQLKYFQQLGRMAKIKKKEVWIVEWGPWNTVPKNPSDLDLAMLQARHMIELINHAGASAFLHWQAVLPYNSFWATPFPLRTGLMRVQFNYSAPFRPIISKQYYAQKHFSLAILPGCRMLAVAAQYSRQVLAAYDAKRQQLVLVAVNFQNAPMRLSLSLSPRLTLKSTNSKGLFAVVYRTSSTLDCKRVFTGILAPSLQRFGGIMLPPQNLMTIVFRGIILK